MDPALFLTVLIGNATSNAPTKTSVRTFSTRYLMPDGLKNYRTEATLLQEVIAVSRLLRDTSSHPFMSFQTRDIGWIQDDCQTIKGQQYQHIGHRQVLKWGLNEFQHFGKQGQRLHVRQILLEL